MNSTHVPREKHIQQPVAQDRHCSKFGAIWWQSQVSFPFLTHTQNNTPHFSWEKSLYTYSFHSHSWSLLNEKPIYGRFELYSNCVQKEATVRVNLLVPHLPHRKPLALPNTTSHQLATGHCYTCYCVVLHMVHVTHAVVYWLYFIGITFYM